MKPPMKLYRVTNARDDAAYYLAASYTDALILATVDGHISSAKPYVTCEDVTAEQLGRSGGDSLAVLIESGMDGKVERLMPVYTVSALADLMAGGQPFEAPVWQFTGPEVTQARPF